MEFEKWIKKLWIKEKTHPRPFPWKGKGASYIKNKNLVFWWIFSSKNINTMKQNDALYFARELRKDQTTSEIFLWKLIRKKRLLGLRFLRQYRIEHSNIMSIKNYFFVDLYYWISMKQTRATTMSRRDWVTYFYFFKF